MSGRLCNAEKTRLLGFLFMDSRDKKELSETDICDLYISPAIKKVLAGTR